MFLGFDGSTTFGPPGSKSEVHELRDYGFISQIRKQLAAMGQTTEYWDGPWIDGFAIRGIWVQAVDFFLTHIGHDHGPNIVAGYSRGGYLAIGFSNVIEHFSKRASSAIASLQHRSILAKEIGFWRREADRIRFLWGGVDGGFSPIAHAPLIDESYLTALSQAKMDGLLLLDPVKRTWNAPVWTFALKSERTLHVRRSTKSISRLGFGFFGKKSSDQVFFGSHASIGGLPGKSISKNIPWHFRDKCMVSLKRDNSCGKSVSHSINKWFLDEFQIALKIEVLVPDVELNQSIKEFYARLLGY